MNVAVILPAAGLGIRMGRTSPEKAGVSRKQFMLLDGSPIFLHTVRKFAKCARVSEIVLAVRADDRKWVEELLGKEKFDKPVRVVEGGDSRQQSVENALATVKPGTDLVAVHDAVRPLIDAATIDRVIDEAAESGAAIVGIVPVDTVKQVERDHVELTVTREHLVLAQTPQVFRIEVLRQAFERARKDEYYGTDESSLVERIDLPVSIVRGSERNIKITRPSDLTLARALLEEERSQP